MGGCELFMTMSYISVSSRYQPVIKVAYTRRNLISILVLSLQYLCHKRFLPAVWSPYASLIYIPSLFLLTASPSPPASMASKRGEIWDGWVRG